MMASFIWNIATFNEGLLEWADGDYVLLLSADDRATPGALGRARDLMDAHPEVGFAYGRALWVADGAPLPRPRQKVRGWSVYPSHQWLERLYRQGENPLSTPTVVVRTSLQHRVSAYDAQLPKAADMEMFMRLAAHADVGFIRGVDQAFYRLHGQNMSSAVNALMDLTQRRSVFEVVLERYGAGLLDTERLSSMVERRLAREALWAAGRVYDPAGFRPSGLGRRLLGAGANQEEGDVEELMAFAAECWPDVKRLTLYRTLESRAKLGPRDLWYMLDEKGQWWLRRRRWMYRGV